MVSAGVGAIPVPTWSSGQVPLTCPSLYYCRKEREREHLAPDSPPGSTAAAQLGHGSAALFSTAKHAAAPIPAETERAACATGSARTAATPLAEATEKATVAARAPGQVVSQQQLDRSLPLADGTLEGSSGSLISLRGDWGGIRQLVLSRRGSQPAQFPFPSGERTGCQ